VTFHEAVAPPTSGTSREKIQVMTQACADVLTEAIREHTQDWHMMQRVFTKDLVGDHASAQAGDKE
jgi:KDO2-lipid IV(A) lauroyltransferase